MSGVMRISVRPRRPCLPDRLVPGGVRDEVGEPPERRDVAVEEVFGDGIRQRF